MKINYYRSLMLVVLGAMLMSCSKEDPTVTNSDKKLETANQADPYEFSFTGDPNNYLSGETAPSNVEFPMPPDNPWEWPNYPYTTVATPTPEYIEETCLVDVSDLENDKTYTHLRNGKFSMGFFSGAGSPTRVIKLKTSSAAGWDSQWGVSPFVENENPDVFYIDIDRAEVIICFSKPLIEFGFEVAPNHKNYEHFIGGAYGDWLFDPAKGVSRVSTRSPSGARLIAVKATKPFTLITVRLGDSPTGDIAARGIAMANFRYKFAK